MTIPVVTAAPLGVTRLDLGDPRWESFVEDHPDGLVYHHPAWTRVLVAEYRTESLCLGCVDGLGAVRGVLPLLRTRGLPFAGRTRLGRRLSSLPRTPLAGPLAADPRAAAVLVRGAVDLAASSPGTRLELKVPADGCPPLTDPAHFVPWRRTYRLELPADASDLPLGGARNRARLRWATGKAARLGVRVREAETAGDLRRWYWLYLETMRRLCLPPRSFRLFGAMWSLLRPRGRMRLLLAECQQPGDARLLAGSLYLMSGGVVFYAFNGSARDAGSLRPNDAIHWRAISDACRSGYRAYDFGEVPDGRESLADSKRKWGASESVLHRWYHPEPPASPLGADAEPDPGPAGRLAREVWRGMPLAATALAGARLYRWL
jgi:hypothetical protein